MRNLLAAVVCLLFVACADQRVTRSPVTRPTATPAPTPVRTWITGDTHVHAHTCSFTRSPQALARALVTNGVNVGSVLVWGWGFDSDVTQFSGVDHPESTPGHILHFDLEVSQFPADQTGHLVLLGLRRIFFSSDVFARPLTGVPIVDWAEAQDSRVLVGMTHGWAWPADGRFPVPTATSCCMPMELPVHLARGRLDFFEVEMASERPGEAINASSARLWATFLSAGFRVPLTGGSDLGCSYDDVGAVRTRALMDGTLADLSYERYLDAVRAGRTVFAVEGARLEFSVSTAASTARKGVGEELRAGSGESVAVRIEVDQPIADTLTLTANGQTVRTFTLPAGASTHETSLVLPQSSWLAVHSSRLQSSAIYVLVDGKPIASPDALCYLRRYLDHLIGLVAADQFPAGRPDEALPAYHEARDILDRRFRDAGGTTCG